MLSTVTWYIYLMPNFPVCTIQSPIMDDDVTVIYKKLTCVFSTYMV